MLWARRAPGVLGASPRIKGAGRPTHRAAAQAGKEQVPGRLAWGIDGKLGRRGRPARLPPVPAAHGGLHSWPQNLVKGAAPHKKPWGSAGHPATEVLDLPLIQY